MLVFYKGTTSAFSLGLVDCVAAGFVAGFYTGIFHYAG
jgi:hypothetical protein